MVRQQLFLFLSTLFLCVSSYAHEGHNANAQQKAKRPCAVSGIIPLQQYVRARDRQCFRTMAQVQSLGLFAFDESSTQSSSKLNNKRCKFLAVKGEQIYFSGNQTRCFRTTKAAENKGFTSYIPKAGPTPVSTPTPTGTITTPPSYPTPSEGSVSFSFGLGPTVAGSGYQGQCNAILSGSRTELTIACTHNVQNATEAHLHVVPDNAKYCVLTTPPLVFTMSCLLSAELGERVAGGNGLVAIHLAPGGAGQAVAGLMR